jgi:hypothetical protein
MLKLVLMTGVLELVLSLPNLDTLAIQNITIYEGDIHSNDVIFNSSLTLELFLLALLVIAGAFLYKKVVQKNINSQSPVKELQNRMEVLETIIVNSDD